MTTTKPVETTCSAVLAAVAVFLAAAALSTAASADALPPNVRVIEYTFTVDNIDEFPDHVFVISPTTNSGFGYVYDPEVGPPRALIAEGRRGEPSRLLAFPRASFEAANPEPVMHPHGINDAMVQVVPNTRGVSLRAEQPLTLHRQVRPSDPALSVERVFHIESLTDSEFVLSIVREVQTNTDGTLQIIISDEAATDGNDAPASQALAAEDDREAVDEGESAAATGDEAPATQESRPKRGCATGRGGFAAGIALWAFGSLMLLRSRRT